VGFLRLKIFDRTLTALRLSVTADGLLPAVTKKVRPLLVGLFGKGAGESAACILRALSGGLYLFPTKARVFMASIQKRGEYQYQVEIRRKGYPRQTQTFETKAQAEAWASEQEHKMDLGQFRDLRPMAKITLGDALDRYLEQVVPRKAIGGQRNERNRIRLLKKHPLAERLLTSLCAADFVAYRDERVHHVGSTNTVRLELALLSHLYTMAIKEWSWPLAHVMKDVKKPAPPEERERRLLGDEEGRLLAAVKHESVLKPEWLETCVRLALATGLRAGEVLTLEWQQVDLRANVLNLTKATSTRSGSKDAASACC
jgi:hypothetical protein